MASVIGLSIEVFLAATLGLTAISLIQTGNYTSWGTTEKLVFQTVLSIVVIVAMILIFLKKAGYNIQI